MTDPRTLAHAADARALAHEIMGHKCCLEHYPSCDDDTALIARIIKIARKEAYERAAKVADREAVACRNMGEPSMAIEADEIAALIRKLGDENG